MKSEEGYPGREGLHIPSPENSCGSTAGGAAFVLGSLGSQNSGLHGSVVGCHIDNTIAVPINLINFSVTTDQFG